MSSELKSDVTQSAERYFSRLNYTLANEDSRVEQACAESRDSILCVAGSGARVIPLLANSPRQLVIADISREQLYLTELRVVAATTLDSNSYRALLGYQNATASQRLIWLSELSLTSECRNYWVQTGDQWSEGGVVYQGKWERHFSKLGRILRWGFGLDARVFLRASSLEEQRALYQTHWSRKRFQYFLKIFASPFVFNRLLYRGRFPADSATTGRYLDERIHELFQTQLFRENYFMQLLFLGRLVTPEALPLEAQSKTLDACRGASTQVIYHHGDLHEAVKLYPSDLYSLSDVPTYLNHDQHDELMRSLYLRGLPGSRAVIRSFLRSMEAATRGVPSNAALANWARSSDCTGVYDFQILELASS